MGTSSRLVLLSGVMSLLVVGGCQHEGVSAKATAAPDGPATTVGKTKLGKREGPAEVPPVTIGSLRFAPIHWGKSRGLGQNGGYIAAYDAATGQELWILKIYTVSYDSRKEEDVQDVFIESLTKTASGDEIQIVDEEGRVYILNPQSRVVRQP